jgi:hypothetical protein
MPGAVPTFTLNEAIIQAVSRLVDDAGDPREPSHSDLEAAFRRANLTRADPHQDPALRVGKQKRVRSVLNWAHDNDPVAGSAMAASLVSMIRGCGGFRVGSSNYCGEEAITTCVASFSGEAVELTSDGVLRPRSLAGLAGKDLTSALHSYVQRAQRGYEDSVLVVGTDKDLLEAVASHVLNERYGGHSQANFPTLLGQAFHAVGLYAKRPKADPGGLDGARAAMSVALYELGCAVSRFRNKAGTGHGRPFIAQLDPSEVRALTEATGLVAGRLLDELES